MGSSTERVLRFDERSLTVMAMLTLVSPVFTVARAQTLGNGGFEVGMKQPDGWYPTYTDWLRSTVEKVEFKWDKQIKHSGERSVSIEILKDHPAYLIFYNWTAVVEGFLIGQTYELTAWVRTENVKRSPMVMVQFWKEIPKRPEWIIVEDRPRPRPWSDYLIGHRRTFDKLDGSRDWTLVSLKFKVPKHTHEVRIRAGVSTEYFNIGKVWFDDIRVVEMKAQL
jgi:hypothetical protein